MGVAGFFPFCVFSPALEDFFLPFFGSSEVRVYLLPLGAIFGESDFTTSGRNHRLNILPRSILFTLLFFVIELVSFMLCGFLAKRGMPRDNNVHSHFTSKDERVKKVRNRYASPNQCPNLYRLKVLFSKSTSKFSDWIRELKAV